MLQVMCLSNIYPRKGDSVVPYRVDINKMWLDESIA